ncbi:FecR family protein [Enterovirga rhinocerotis]|uniref:FecR family protein n=1 Tax=Enterovirga rhinocerotis TaxID=1339210 RepID=A0A4R7BIU2_9HYPH|nr:FecR family protein [Enterovirga rhinocerotis]TDR85244.1 FecR family protein [Enterovirga rhinocerotis]
MTAKQSARIRRRRHEEAADWLFRNRDARHTARDADGFREWLNLHPDNLSAYQAAERLMGEARGVIMKDPALRDLKVAPRPSAAKSVVSSLAALCVAGGLFLALDGPMRLQADVITGAGEMPVVTLADGSTMQLNASSAVAYDFTPARRTVRLLRGQAFFQVARDPRRPFTVEGRGGSTTALGTAFDIRLGDGQTDVTVTEHAVSVAPTGSSRPPIRVEQGQQAAYGQDGSVTEIRPADPLTALAWRRGLLVVDGASLAEVVAEIGRHFAGRIVIAGGALAERRVSGTVSIVDTDAALAFLEQSLGVTATRFGPLIVIRG